MKSASIRKVVFFLIALTTATSTWAQAWQPIDTSNFESSAIYVQITKLNMDCQALSVSFDEQVALGACRDTKDQSGELGIYSFNKKGASYSKKRVIGLDDSSTARVIELHSPGTLKSHTDEPTPTESNKQDERIVLFDLSDEANCYATEVFALKNGIYKQLGTITESTLSYSLSPGETSYVVESKCLGQSAKVEMQNSVPVLTFWAPKLYKTDESNGNPIALKSNVLKYEITPTGLKIKK